MAHEHKCITSYCPTCQAQFNSGRSMYLPGMDKARPLVPRFEDRADIGQVRSTASNNHPEGSDINTEYHYDMEQRHGELDQCQGSTDYNEFVALLSRPSDSLADTARIKAGKGQLVPYPQADGRETSSSRHSRSDEMDWEPEEALKNTTVGTTKVGLTKPMTSGL
ncbi:hypothetical protein ACMFMG_001901 [Clarireedia jacksonii]